MAGQQKKETPRGIYFNSWDYLRDTDMAKEMIKNMIKMGSPVVYRGNVMCWLVYDELGIRAQQMNKDNLRAEMDETNIYQIQKSVQEVDPMGYPSKDKDGNPIMALTPKASRIPGAVIDSAYGMRNKPLYKLRGVLSHPLINKNGEYVILNGLYWKDEEIKGVKVKKPFIHLDDGYDPVTQYFFGIPERVTKELTGIQNLVPTMEQVQEAVGFIEFFLDDFEFATRSAKASAIAFMLTMICWEMIGARIPMLEIRAPESQSGKSFLASMMIMAITGAKPSMFSPNFRNPEEFEKELFSLLLQGQNYILMDNVKGTVDSAFLDMVLTTAIANKRILGVNATGVVESGMPFIMTANNPKLSEDIKNRIYLLDITKPPDDKDYLHKHPEADALEMGPKLLRALFTLYNHWDKNLKRKRFKARRISGFIEWCEIIGGILEAAGIEGFLDDTLVQIKEPDPRREQAAGLARDWYEKYGNMWVFVKDTFDFAITAGYVKEKDNYQSKLQSINNMLLKMRRVPLPGGYMFEKNDDVTRGSQWRVIQDAGSTR